MILQFIFISGERKKIRTKEKRRSRFFWSEGVPPKINLELTKVPKTPKGNTDGVKDLEDREYLYAQ